MKRLRKIHPRWKGHVEILNTLKEKAMLLEDKRSIALLKVSNVVNELEGPRITKDSTFLSHDEFETKLQNSSKSGLKNLIACPISFETTWTSGH